MVCHCVLPYMFSRALWLFKRFQGCLGASNNITSASHRDSAHIVFTGQAQPWIDPTDPLSL